MHISTRTHVDNVFAKMEQVILRPGARLHDVRWGDGADSQREAFARGVVEVDCGAGRKAEAAIPRRK